MSGAETPPDERARLQRAYLARVPVLDASQLAFAGERREWRLDEVREVWARGPVPGAPPAVNHVYVHVPFCKSICHFCNYQRLRVSRPEAMQRWLDGVTDVLEALRPGLQAHTFHTLYLGGGTPSVLPLPLLAKLLDALDAAVPFHALAGRQIELDPATITREAIRLLTRRGFHGFSMGVETLDAEVNRRHGRGPQDAAMVERAFAALTAEGVARVSCDFLLGLAGTTPQRMLDEVDFVLQRFRPYGVDVYQLIPTEAYLARHFGGDRARFDAHRAPFVEAAQRALPALAERHGYRLRSGQHHGHALRRRLRAADLLRWDRLVRGWSPFRYAQLTAEQRRPLSLLGLGPSARTLVFGRAQLDLQDGGSGTPRFVGRALDLAGEARSFLVHRLRDRDVVDRAGFEALFGASLEALLGEALAAWQAQGLATLDGRALTLAPQDRRARFEALLQLLPEHDLRVEVDRHRGHRFDR